MRDVLIGLGVVLGVCFVILFLCYMRMIKAKKAYKRGQQVAADFNGATNNRPPAEGHRNSASRVRPPSVSARGECGMIVVVVVLVLLFINYSPQHRSRFQTTRALNLRTSKRPCTQASLFQMIAAKSRTCQSIGQRLPAPQSRFLLRSICRAVASIHQWIQTPPA